MKLTRWFFRKRFQYILLTSIFALTVTLSVICGSSLPIYSQTNTSTPRQELILEIKQSAERHVRNDSSMKTEHIVDLFKENQVGLNPREISRIYEEEYDRLRKLNQGSKSSQENTNFWQQLLLTPKKLTWGTIGWGTAIILFFLLIFRDIFVNWLTKGIDTAGNWFYNKLAGSPLLLRTALNRYRKSLVTRYQELKIVYRPNRSLDMAEVYVPLEVAGSSDNKQIEAKEAIAEYPRLMVKGVPGSGKSVLLKHLALIYGKEGCLNNLPTRPIPVLVELHKLTDPTLDLKKLVQHLVTVLDHHNFPKAERFISQSLKQDKLLLLFDGLDEVNSDVRRQVVQAIKNLLQKYQKCRALITCRTAVYNNEFNNVVSKTLEIVEFNDRQIRLFLKSWSSQMPPEKSIEQLLRTLRDKPRIITLARNPLLLTIIAYLYCDTTYVLPDSRAEFYRKSTDVLLELRDEERNIANKYRANEKKRVLQKLALYNQDNAQAQQQDRRSINYETVLAEIQKVLPSLNLNPNQDTKAILQEIVERSGLFIQIDLGDKYQFAHLSIQEFFAAEALKDNWHDLVVRYKKDPNAWRETVKLWCGLDIDSTELIQAVYDEDALLAFECLADAQEVDQDLATTIIDQFKNQLGRIDNDDNLVKVFEAVATTIIDQFKNQLGRIDQFKNQLGRIDNDDDLAKAFGAVAKTIIDQFKNQLGRIDNDDNLAKAFGAVAAECLADAQEVDQDLAKTKTIIDQFKNQLGRIDNDDNLAKAFGAVAASSRTRGQVVFEFLKEILATEAEPFNNVPIKFLTMLLEIDCLTGTLFLCKYLNRRNAAAVALSLTNLPQAAQALSHQYSSDTIKVRQVLVKMGDIAVPELVSKADEGYIDSLNDLFAIATPAAATALVPFLWRTNQELSSLAAWNLAALISQSDIEESLHNFPLTVEKRQADYLDWIWQPFPKPINSSVPIIAGRIAYLLKMASRSAIFISEQNLDPRIVIPLCAIELKNQGEFEYRWNPDWDNLVAYREQSLKLDREMNKLLTKLLSKSNTNSYWKLIFSSLSLRLQLDLLRRLSSYQPPTIFDWRNLFLEFEYEFKSSWHYRLVLVLALAMSILAIAAIFIIMVRQSEPWSNGLLGLAVLVIIAFWTFFWRGIEEKLEPTTFSSFGLFGFLTFWQKLRQLFIENIVWAGAVAVTVAVALASIMAMIGVWAGTLALVGAGIGAVVVTGIVAVAGTEAWAWSVTGAIVVIGAGAGAVAGVFAGADAGAAAGAVAGGFAGVGVGAWARAKDKQDFVRLFAIFAYPFFCWSPIVFGFSTLALLEFLSWQYTVLAWLIVLGGGTALWRRGQKLEAQARNPLRGILD